MNGAKKYTEAMGKFYAMDLRCKRHGIATSCTCGAAELRRSRVGDALGLGRVQKWKIFGRGAFCLG